jgi:hypothetical protein
MAHGRRSETMKIVGAAVTAAVAHGAVVPSPGRPSFRHVPIT